MNSVINDLKLGQLVRINNTPNGQSEFVYEVTGASEDDVVLNRGESKDRDCGHIVLARKIRIDGSDYVVGDKVFLETKDKKKREMYITYITNKDMIVLSFKKKPSYSSLKWLLKLMTNNLTALDYWGIKK